MSFEPSGLPISGGMFFTIVVVIGTSIVTGQEVARRQIDLSGWDTRCPTELVANARADLQSKRKPRETIPEKRCSAEASKLPTILGGYRDLALLICKETGDRDLNGAAREAEEKLQDEINALDAQRVARIRAKSGSQCACAKTKQLQDSLVQNAVHVGTVGIVSFPAVVNREEELKKTLHSADCAALSEAVR